MLYSLNDQLQVLFEKTHVLNISESAVGSKSCDVSDGSEYRNLKISFPETITLTCNTDGVPLFSSSNSSLWPVYFVINELPLKMRLIHMMPAALWTGRSKPEMETLFTPIVKELYMIMVSNGFVMDKLLPLR